MNGTGFAPCSRPPFRELAQVHSQFETLMYFVLRKFQNTVVACWVEDVPAFSQAVSHIIPELCEGRCTQGYAWGHLQPLLQIKRFEQHNVCDIPLELRKLVHEAQCRNRSAAFVVYGPIDNYRVFMSTWPDKFTAHPTLSLVG